MNKENVLTIYNPCKTWRFGEVVSVGEQKGVVLSIMER
jgi:hypothetical protein